MGQQSASEQQFNDAVQRVLATAPAGLSEEEFNRLVDAELMGNGAPYSFGLEKVTGIGPMTTDAKINTVLGDPGPMGNAARSAKGGMALPIGGQANVLDPAIRSVGNFLSRRAVPMVRSALKQGFEGVRKRAGIEGAMPSVVANRQAQFVIDKQLRTPDQADALVKSTGRQIDDLVSTFEQQHPDAAIDSAERIPRYLNEFLRTRVEQQILPRADRMAVQNTARELVEDSPLSRSTYQAPAAETLEEGLARGTNVARAIRANRRRPHIKDDGQHQFTSQGGAYPQSSRPRELRTDVKPSEALTLVRNKSFFDKDAPQGRILAGKQIERAVRDGVKDLVPETTPLLRDQGRAMDAREALDRATWRDANRDQVGMGGLLGFASGRPLLGLLLQGMKEGQLRTGLALGRTGPQISRDATQTSEALSMAIQRLLAGQAQDE